MVTFYKKWKKYNEIQFTKKQNGLEQSNNKKSSTLPVRLHKTSNTHRTELIENSLMVDHIKGCAEINMYDSSLLPL